MLCEVCQQNPVSVHMQQIVNGEKKELHLCQECSAKMELPISFDIFFKGFLDSFFSANLNSLQKNQKTNVSAKCPGCGMSYIEFKKTGRLGCGGCYTAFRNEMDGLLKNIQGSVQHNGKFPKKFGQELFNRRTLENLRFRLSKAIENEEYEEAAGLRDQIREIERGAVK